MIVIIFIMSMSKFENLELLARVTAIDISDCTNGGGGISNGNGKETYNVHPHHTTIVPEQQIKAKRKRASTYQIDLLRKVYKTEGQFPSSYRRDELAKELRMSPRSVQIWFQNQRQLSKKE